MLKHRVITLDTEGAFVVPVGDAMCQLIFDGDVAQGRWLLMDVPQDGRQASLLSIHHDLDRGLDAVAAAAGWSGQRYRVDVGNGQGFYRPGKVDAARILAGMGYMLVRSVVCYAIFEPVRAIGEEEARAEFVRRLAGRGLSIGSVDPVGMPDKTWCADVSIPYEGYIHSADVPGLVDECMRGSKLEISGVEEAETVDFAAPHVSDVTPFPVAA